MSELDEFFGLRVTIDEAAKIPTKKLISTLPIPGRDKMPPRVQWSEEGLKEWKEEEEFKKSLLDTHKDTERFAKYVLSSQFNANVQKDGDWETLASGVSVWRKRTADFFGSIVLGGYPRNPALWVEVKGVSPYKPFALSRLTKPNKEGQPSQWVKLTEKHEAGNIVFLMIGWWDAIGLVDPIIQTRGSKTYTLWRREDLRLTFSVIEWGDWLENIHPQLRYKSIRQQDRDLLAHCSVFKDGQYWQLTDNHWFYNFRKG